MIKKSLVWLYSTTTYILWASIILVAAVVLSLRYLVLPHIEEYKDRIAQELSRTAGQKITIGGIKAGWDGMNPYLDLRQVDLYDAQNRVALSLDHIETSLSWLSLPLGEPRLASLIIHQPRLTVRREADGTLYVAGISMSGPSRPEFPNWLLRQSRVDIVDASVVWQDDLRKAPPLSLEKLTLQIFNPPWERFLGRHRFGLRATPSVGASQPIDVRGDFYGTDVAHPEKWHGTLYAKAEGTEIASWRTWIPLPDTVRKGFGAAQVWLDFAGGHAEQATADVVLTNVRMPLTASAAETTFRSLSARLSWKHLPDGQEFRADQVRLTSDDLQMRDGKLRLRNRNVAGKELADGSIRLDDINLEHLVAFARNFPLSEENQQAIGTIAPKGRLRHFELDWDGTSSAIQAFGLRSQFSQLSMNAYRGIPGFTNLTGSVDATQAGGTLTLSAENTALDLKDVLRWPLPVNKLSGQANWKNHDGVLEVKVSNLAIASPHITGTVNADYRYAGKGSGTLDLTGKFGRADGRFAHYYYPTVLSKDTLNWLDTSILSGHGEDVNVVVRGDLDEFPWADGKRGLFQIDAKITDGVLDYAVGWPKIEGIKLDLLFRGNRMELTANDGHIYGSRILKAKAIIPVLDADHPVLEVTGDIQSPAAEAIKFINGSPVLEATDRFTEGMKATGNGRLALGLRIPLDTDGVGSRVKGSYVIADGTLNGQDGFPPLSGINGRLDFTETSLRAQNVSARIFGGPAQFSLENGKDGLLHVSAQGHISDSGIRQVIASPLTDKIYGSTDWTGEINVRKNQVDLMIKSSLLGLASSLPAPFDKSDTTPLALVIDKKMQDAQHDLLGIALGDTLSARLLLNTAASGSNIERGEINFGGTAELPTQNGLVLRGNLAHVDVDQWQNILNSAGKQSRSAEISAANLAIGTLDVFGRRINELKLDAKVASSGWRAAIQSREINGDVQWVKDGNGKIIARLKSLTVPGDAPPKLSAPIEQKQQDQDYPALDIISDSFEFKKKALGRLELLANPQGMDWNIDKLVIGNPDSTLAVNGVWSSWKRHPSTKLNLTWNISNIGKTLDRFGYPETVKGGSADLSGKLRWTGSPTEFNSAILGGNLQFHAKDGQFLKIKPGVGRLLGILSLQTLPRRLVFDFRDLFSAGFAFDQIDANVRIDNGVMRSDDFSMQGPAAKVDIKGETDLAHETQNLHIKVTPSLSDSLSVAAFAGGPAVGVAAIVAQKLLNDPFNKLVAYEYDITGTWDDPQEVKSKSTPATTPSATPVPQ